MRLSLIVAASENGVIGHNGTLPWHLPKDLKHFKATTLGGTLLMGRKTWDSIGKPLPKRRSLVMSRNPGFEAPGAEVFPDLDTSLAAANGEDELFVIGGAALYRLTLPRADRLYLTRVHAEIEGDVFLPAIDFSQWKLLEETAHPADERHAYPFTFQTYQRLRQPTEAHP